MFEYNNYDFKKEFYKNKKNLSAVIMEVSRNFPPKKFLKKLRKLYSINNTVLIFDECTSGLEKHLEDFI